VDLLQLFIKLLIVEVEFVFFLLKSSDLSLKLSDLIAAATRHILRSHLLKFLGSGLQLIDRIHPPVLAFLRVLVELLSGYSRL
jgi:hypothetical protein